MAKKAKKTVKKKKKAEAAEAPKKEVEKKVVKEEVVKAVEMKTEPVKKEEPKKIEKVKTMFADEIVIAENCDAARELYNQSRYGALREDGRLQLSLIEAFYLLEKGKIDVLNKNKKLTFEGYLKLAKNVEPNFWIRYCVYKDMRTRGYVVKTALKFGADFRVYDRGVKPGEDHAKWIIYPVHEGSTLTWYEFAAKNRVAHSTKKRLMMGIVDEEGDVTYYEIRWMRP